MRRICLLLSLLVLVITASITHAANSPSVTQQPTNTTVEQFRPAQFSVTASGAPPLRYQWRQGNSNIPNATNFVYVLPSAHLSDDNTAFMVVITNNFGLTLSSNAILRVFPDTNPPVLVQAFSSTNFTQVIVKFSEGMSGGPASDPANYALDGGLAVSGATLLPDGVTVVLDVGMLTEGANYTLTVSGVTDLAGNPIAPDPSQFAFQAAVPPSIITQPHSVMVNLGDDASFSVEASGTAPLSYQWFKGLNPVPANGTDPTLMINNVKASDLGTYRVVIMNSAGAIPSVPVNLGLFEGYTLDLPAGYSFVANQLHNPNMGFPTPPDGTVLYRWDPATQGYSPPYTYIGAVGWDPQEPNIPPGEGVLVNLPIAATLTFSGQRVVPMVPTNLPPGLNLISAQLPINAGFNDLVAAPPAEGQIIYHYIPGADPSQLDADNYRVTYFLGGIWHDRPPKLAVGEAVWMNVLNPVIINTQPIAQTNLSLGQSVFFTVSLSSATTFPVHYQWRLNGTAIPGATNSDLNISSMNLSNCGLYSVSVGNILGDISSLTAPLKLNLPDFALTDSFSAQPVVNDFSRTFNSDNRGATREPGEPLHGGKNTPSSVWFTWQAPDNGIMVMSAAGSAFDTVLTAYTGSTVSNLTQIDTSDDDAGYACSRIAFNAHVGVSYRICVSGLGDETGDILLDWNLESTSEVLPEILSQPQDLSVTYGNDAQFSVVLTNGSYNYQWFHDGSPIAGAGQSNLTLNSVSDADLGSYRVRVSNGQRFRDSAAATLQVETPEPGHAPSGARAVAKFFDATIAAGPGGGVPLKGPPPHKLGGTVNHGYSGNQTVSSVGAGKDPGEPNHCGETGGNSVWYVVQATNTGTMYVNTDGSSFNTVLAAYIGPGNSYSTLTNVDCDNNSGLDGLDSSMGYLCTSNTIYYLAVDGVGGASGTVKLAYHVTLPLSITNLFYTNIGGGRFTMKINTTPGLTNIVQYRTNLISTNWVSLLTNTVSTTSFNFTNNGLGGTTNRYYRVFNRF